MNLSGFSAVYPGFQAAENTQAEVDAAQPRLPVLADYSGPATVVAYTVAHGRDGSADRGLVVLDTPHGRAMARVHEPALLADAEERELVGQAVTVTTDGKRNEARAAQEAADKFRSESKARGDNSAAAQEEQARLDAAATQKQADADAASATANAKEAEAKARARNIEQIERERVTQLKQIAFVINTPQRRGGGSDEAGHGGGRRLARRSDGGGSDGSRLRLRLLH